MIDLPLKPARADGLFVFTRFPQPGCTKTRLIPALGEQGAADMQRQMTEHLMSRFQGRCQNSSFEQAALSVQVHFAGGTAEQMSSWLGESFTFVLQREGDLGERLTGALQQGFTSGLNRIAVIGSDCPELELQQVTQALQLLNRYDAVLGPALDGGYYLIALKQPLPFLFENIPWSTKRVFEKTKAIAASHNLSIALLKPLSDIDEPEDLPLWYALQPTQFGLSSSAQSRL